MTILLQRLHDELVRRHYYGDDAQKRITLEISDTGGASGLVGLASWASLRDEKEDDNGSERTLKVDGRLVHEKTSKRPGSTKRIQSGAGRALCRDRIGSWRGSAGAEGRGHESRSRQARVDEGRGRHQIAMVH